MAVIWVLLLTEKANAADAPKRTALTPVKPVPLMVTVLPPAVLPDDGLGR